MRNDRRRCELVSPARRPFLPVYPGHGVGRVSSYKEEAGGSSPSTPTHKDPGHTLFGVVVYVVLDVLVYPIHPSHASLSPQASDLRLARRAPKAGGRIRPRRLDEERREGHPGGFACQSGLSAKPAVRSLTRGSNCPRGAACQRPRESCSFDLRSPRPRRIPAVRSSDTPRSSRPIPWCATHQAPNRWRCRCPRRGVVPRRR